MLFVVASTAGVCVCLCVQRVLFDDVLARTEPVFVFCSPCRDLISQISAPTADLPAPEETSLFTRFLRYLTAVSVIVGSPAASCNGGDTLSRNLRKKLAQVSCASLHCTVIHLFAIFIAASVRNKLIHSFLHQIFVQVHASSADDTSNKKSELMLMRRATASV